MLYLDYVWDLAPNTIIPDVDIDTEKLKWKAGDFWQVKEVNGKLIFCKVDPLLQFVLEGTINGHS